MFSLSDNNFCMSSLLQCNNASDKDVLTNYVNNSLLKRFSKLNINRMRSNALGKLGSVKCR